MAVDLNTKKIINDFGLNQNGKVHSFFTDACALHMDKYVPFDTGVLAGTVAVNGVSVNRDNVDENSITYNQDYASYVYNGISKNGKPLDYSHDKHKYAGDHWDELMVSAEMTEIEKEVQNYLDKIGGSNG